jgi:hypothetical protein
VYDCAQTKLVAIYLGAGARGDLSGVDYTWYLPASHQSVLKITAGNV